MQVKICKKKKKQTQKKEREKERKRETDKTKSLHGPCNYDKMRRNLGLVLKEGTEYRKKKTLLFKSPLLDESQSTPPEFEIQPSRGQGK